MSIADSSNVLGKLLRSFRVEFVVVGVYSFILNLLMLVPTLYMLQVYDRVMQSRNVGTLIAISLVTVFMFVIMSVAEWARARLLVRIGVRLDHLLAGRVFQAAFAASLSSVDGLRQRALQDVAELRQFLTGNSIITFFDVPWTPVYIGVSFVLHPLLGALSVLFVLIQIALAVWGRRRQELPLQRVNEAQADAQTFLQQKLREAEVVEAMGMLPALFERWRGLHGRTLSLQAEASEFSHQVTAVSKFVRYVQQSMSLCVGALLVIEGKLSPGSMIAANVLMSRALAPFDHISVVWRSVVGVRGAFARLSPLLADQVTHVGATRTEPPSSGRLHLRSVSATAPGCSVPILAEVELCAEPGSVTVIVGPSGSGKSTLAKAVLGIWPNAQGEVLLDGVPIHEYRRDVLGGAVGYLPQDIELMTGTIAENIARFGTVESERVVEAAQATGLHETILRFPRGYDTPFDSLNSSLSGGQMQRIALARAVYGAPKLLVLDEPNANLDESGEQALFKAVQTLRAKGCTILLITHRPAAVALADRMVVMAAGRIARQGTREEVMLRERQEAATADLKTPSSNLPVTET